MLRARVMKHFLPCAASIALAAPVGRAETDYPLTEDSKPPGL